MKFIILMPGKIKQFITQHQRLFISLLFVLVGIFFVGKSVLALGISDLFGFDTFSDMLAYIVARLAMLFIGLLGGLFVEMVTVLIDIAKFNQFITLDIVKTGWGLARDVANMFFIVVLLIIAFSTVLKISSYHYQKTLFKLVIMAVLVNFSKLICGFLIDFFQVIMLTFVNGFKDVLGGNFAQGFGLYEMLSLASTAESVNIDIDYSGIAIAAVVSLILILVADMTILIMAAVLLWRIAMLWILVIISPLAYLSYAIMPKYWSQWWQMFFQHLVSGPVIAFFLWLSLLTIQQENIADKFKVSGTEAEKKEQIKTIFATNINNELFLQYMVMLALLMGGLAISQKIASQSGSAVGNFAQKVQKYGTRAAMIGTGAAGVGWALKKGKEKGVDSLKGLATTSPFRGGLGYLASRQGFWGGALAATGIRRLATVGLAKAEVEKKAREDKQLNFYGKIKDTRVRERVVNGRFNTAARRVVSDTSPSLVHGPRAQEVVNDLSQEQIGRLSDSELTSLGRRAGAGEIDVNGTRLGNHLARNVNDRALYNFGVEQRQVEELTRQGVDEVTARAAIRRDNINRLEAGENIDGMVVGQNRDGHDLQLPSGGNAEEFYNSAYGPTRVGHFDYDRALRRNNFDHKYRLADTDDMKKGRGAGNTSINKFSQGSSNAVAVDFDKLDKEKTDFLKNFDTAAEVKGVTLDTPDKITKAATQLAAILDDEVNKLRSSGGSEQDIQNLEQTRDRLGSPEKLSNLQLLNSSAHGYSNSDLKKTYIHEKVHGMGVTSEKDAESLTQGIIDNRLYSSLEKLATAVAGGKNVDAVIAAELTDISSGQASPPPSAKTKTEFTPSEEKIEIKAKTKSEIEEPVTPSPTRSSADEKKKPEEVKKTSSPEGVVKKESEGISKEVTLLAAIKKILEDKKKL